ncbi:enoyl-CoA hydratase [Pueribacillus theae]|uniref:Enoyl-CoA hydratase domain-containing protein 3, mitochondrial n=1 Tax=Pueribacillus theae TaxID=2171751 RepID=A0A2U1JUL8_9BACI|nr:enoyl-CoA hydratase [Pueribacillus theae]PWA08897.1 enoyl-CoA hydratase [Pueribacillus theae]
MEFISYKENGKIGTITLQNDKQRNALSLPLIQELDHLLKKIGTEKNVNVLIFEAEGKVFSSGHNLREVANQPQQDVLHLFQECAKMMRTLRDIPQITIAKVHGIATAAGCQLVAACDLAVASERAQFATPGAHIGLFCSTPAVFVSRNVGRKKAAEMLFTGDFITADDALLHGLVNKVVPHEELEQATEELAQSVARHSLAVLNIGKNQFYQQLQMEDFQALNYSSEVISLNSSHPDAIEGISAFLEKRQPEWSDRSNIEMDKVK